VCVCVCVCVKQHLVPFEIRVPKDTYNGKVVSGNAMNVQGGSNMTGTDLCVNKPHCAAAVRP